MLSSFNDLLSGIVVPALLCAAGVFFCIRLRLFYLIHPVRVIRSLRSGKRGGVSSAKAVTLALAGTLGVGNIVGVTSAIHLGGFGAVFWMWISALFAMILKYAEIVLAMRHKKHFGDGSSEGGAIYYIKAFFCSIGMRRLGTAVCAVFSAAFLICSLTMGSMLQSSAVSESLEGVLGVPASVTGIVLAVGVFFAAFRGTKSIVRLSSFLVPLMSVGYVVMSLAVIALDLDRVGEAFSLIFKSALSPSAAAGGVGGFAFSRAVRYGVMRGLVSNEAGCGTAPAAHAVADCDLPARQGIWGIVEVFVDTVVLCTLSALVVILEYGAVSAYAGNYMMMSAAAFSARLGEGAAVFLCVCVLCFGFATALCWAHYGFCAMRWLFPSRTLSLPFLFIYCASVFLGTCVSTDLSWLLCDLSMGVMTVINLSVCIGSSREIVRETQLLLS